MFAAATHLELIERLRFAPLPFERMAEQQTDIKRQIDRIDLLLRHIGQPDQQLIERFWERLVFQQPAGHVLFGDKAAALCVSRTMYVSGAPSIDRNVSPDEWNAWNSNKGLFDVGRAPIQIVELDEITPGDGPLGSGPELHRNFMLFRPERVRQVVEQHRSEFVAEFGEAVNAVSIIRRMQDARQFNQIFNGNETLSALVLGYGRHNGELFQELTNRGQPKHSRMVLIADYMNIPINAGFNPRFFVDPNSDESAHVAASFDRSWRKIFALYSSAQKSSDSAAYLAPYAIAAFKGINLDSLFDSLFAA